MPPDSKYFGGAKGPHPITRGLSVIDVDKIKKLVKKLEWPLELKTNSGKKAWQNLVWATSAGNAAVMASVGAKKQADKRKIELNRMVAAGDFLSAQESAEEYKMLGVEQKKVCLLNSLGYLRTFKFHLTQTQVLGLPGLDDLGKIQIGRKKVGDVVNGVGKLLNKEVGEIFGALKDLSDSLNRFFANLDKDVGGEAITAISSAQSISQKDILASKVKKTDPEQATQLPLPGLGE